MAVGGQNFAISRGLVGVRQESLASGELAGDFWLNDERAVLIVVNTQTEQASHFWVGGNVLAHNLVAVTVVDVVSLNLNGAARFCRRVRVERLHLTRGHCSGSQFSLQRQRQIGVASTVLRAVRVRASRDHASAFDTPVGLHEYVDVERGLRDEHMPGLLIKELY